MAPGVIILEQTYSSRPGGLSFCQAGQEQFLRVLNLHNPAQETLRVKLNSCLESLDLDDTGVVWNAGERTLEIHWLNKAPATYRVLSDGTSRLTAKEKP